MENLFFSEIPRFLGILAKNALFQHRGTSKPLKCIVIAVFSTPCREKQVFYRNSTLFHEKANFP